MFTRLRSHAWRTGLRPSLAVLILIVCGTMLGSDFVSAQEITRKAYRIAHKGQVDTDLTFNEFFGSSFAITAWVMPEFTHNWKGAIFTVKGLSGSGTFQVGQGDYRAGNGGFLQAGDPVLEVTMNGATARYLAPEYQRRKWNHIAIVRGNVMFARTHVAALSQRQEAPGIHPRRDDQCRRRDDVSVQSGAGRPLQPGRKPAAERHPAAGT